MDRKDELVKIVCKEDQKNKTLLLEVIEDVLFLERQLEELKKLPFIAVNPKNIQQQKATPAAKQYKELLQQYTNCIKLISRTIGAEMQDKDNPLLMWLKRKNGGD